jgi:hypothetical protein
MLNLGISRRHRWSPRTSAAQVRGTISDRLAAMI